MDNLCHTLTGAAFGEAGLKRRTRFGSATLMIAANLPDLDVLAFATSTPAVALRRGWTHGVLAQLLLPVLLAVVVYAIGRRKTAPSHPRTAAPAPPHPHLRTPAPSHLRAPTPSHPHFRTPAPSHPRTDFAWLLALSYIGVLSHVGMDLLNSYGIRLLAPLDWGWFYGDAVFIIDVWLWLALGAGVWMARRHDLTRAAQAALVVSAIYIGAMCVNARLARATVIDTWQMLRAASPRAVMVGPLPVTPARRTVIIDAGDHYETGTFSWPNGDLRLDSQAIPKNVGDPRVTVARAAPDIAAFLVWSRFPFWTLEERPDGTLVTVSDVRFAGRGGTFSESVVVPRLTTKNTRDDEGHEEKHD